MNRIEVKRLGIEDLYPTFLSGFNRYQDVKRCWRKENDQWVLRNISYIEQWDENEKKSVCNDLISCVQNGGKVVGAFEEGALVGFASVEGKRFGSQNQYSNLSMMHTSCEHRNKGIGKKLFDEVCSLAKALGAKKLYISAHSAEETMAFYRKIGCVDAVETNKILAEKEPCDCQLEYAI